VQNLEADSFLCNQRCQYVPTYRLLEVSTYPKHTTINIAKYSSINAAAEY